MISHLLQHLILCAMFIHSDIAYRAQYHLYHGFIHSFITSRAQQRDHTINDNTQPNAKEWEETVLDNNIVNFISNPYTLIHTYSHTVCRQRNAHKHLPILCIGFLSFFISIVSWNRCSSSSSSSRKQRLHYIIVYGFVCSQHDYECRFYYVTIGSWKVNQVHSKSDSLSYSHFICGAACRFVWHTFLGIE